MLYVEFEYVLLYFVNDVEYVMLLLFMDKYRAFSTSSYVSYSSSC